MRHYSAMLAPAICAYREYAEIGSDGQGWRRTKQGVEGSGWEENVAPGPDTAVGGVFLGRSARTTSGFGE